MPRGCRTDVKRPALPSLKVSISSLLLLTGLGAWSAPAGPYDIPLLAGPAVPQAKGAARLYFVESPFGVSVTQDGRHRYDVRITLTALPEPTTLGAFQAYVAWEVSPDLAQWQRLGAVANGVTTVGPVDWNKFLLVITAEPDSAPAVHSGPTMLHGTSPSGLLQRFFSHPLFRGISQ